MVLCHWPLLGSARLTRGSTPFCPSLSSVVRLLFSFLFPCQVSLLATTLNLLSDATQGPNAKNQELLAFHPALVGMGHTGRPEKSLGGCVLRC